MSLPKSSCPAVGAALLLCGLAAGAAEPGSAPAIASASNTARSAPRKTVRLSDLLEAIRRETGVPALAAAVSDRERLVESAAVGRRRSDEPASVSRSDAFHLGSDTKAMTAFVLARLVERGILRWDATLADVFPEWRDSMDESYRRVVLADLPRHRAGVPALTSPADAALLEGVDFARPPVEQRLALARNVLHRPPAVRPGEFLYSNAGYVVVGAALEKHTRRSWEDLIQAELFSPLGMASCGFGPTASGEQRGRVFGHRVRADGSYEPTDRDNPPVLGPAGTVHCSLADWAAFVRANMDAPRRALVTPETAALLREPLPMGDARKEDKTDYAMGWGSAQSAWAGERVLAHDGSNGSNYATVHLAPRRGLAFLVAVNAGDERAQRAAKLCYERLVERHGGGVRPPAAAAAGSTGRGKEAR